MRPPPAPPKRSSGQKTGTSWALLVVGLVACTSAPDARFRGANAPPVVGVDDLRQHDYVPHDHLAIGEVEVHCEHDVSEQDGDDRCSELELLRTLREATARAGGTAFVAPSCQYEAAPPLQRIRCAATVARRRSLLPATAKAADASAAQEHRWDERIEGSEIRVTARPNPGVTPTPRKQPARRVWGVAPGVRPLGTVLAECVEPCERDRVERGLERGAAWIGAEAVARIQCHEVRAGRWSCTGDAVTPP